MERRDQASLDSRLRGNDEVGVRSFLHTPIHAHACGMTQNILTPIAAGAAPQTLTRINPARHWTGGKQAEFLRHLAATHSVSRAAKSVGMSRQSAYRLRNRLRGEPFDIAWGCAFRRQYDALAEAALERALGGVEVPHYYKGELIGTHRVFDERLTVALLSMRERLTPIPRDIHAEQELFSPDDFETLVERVGKGEELWAEAEAGVGPESGREFGPESGPESGREPEHELGTRNSGGGQAE